MGKDDGENHEHGPIPLNKRTTKCVLCCKLCFSTDGKVFIRDKYHLGDTNAKSQADTIETRDYGRQGNGASVKCSVCAVHLCHSPALGEKILCRKKKDGKVQVTCMVAHVGKALHAACGREHHAVFGIAE